MKKDANKKINNSEHVSMITRSCESQIREEFHSMGRGKTPYQLSNPIDISFKEIAKIALNKSPKSSGEWYCMKGKQG